jgi:hypothetical protein
LSDWDALSRGAAGTPSALGRQLSTLPCSSVTEPLTPSEAFGRDTLHLQLRINSGCPSGENYRIADGDVGDLCVTYGENPTTVIADIWVVDLTGPPVTGVRESISFVSSD